MIDVTALQKKGSRCERTAPAPVAIPRGLNEIQGRAQFYIGANINVHTFKEWSPERIRMFFDGIARVILARGKPSA